MLCEFGENLIETSEESVELYDYQIESMFSDHDLRLCRYLLAKRPMSEFLKQYVESLSLKEPIVNEDLVQFHEEGNNYNCRNGEEMECSCGYHEKTGIPCKHIIWVCRTFNISYMKGVHPRWQFNKDRFTKTTTRRRRETRRRK